MAIILPSSSISTLPSTASKMSCSPLASTGFKGYTFLCLHGSTRHLASGKFPVKIAVDVNWTLKIEPG